MHFSRHWAMPSPDTFSVKPIGEFVQRYLATSKCSIDPFARNKRWATFTNNLNPETSAAFHIHAADFCRHLQTLHVQADLVLFDPPYSPRQISECYKQVGRACTTRDTQNALLYKEVRNALMPLLTPDAVVLSFGWSSNGFGKGHNFEIVELMLCCHGSAHNDTICVAERRVT